MTVGFALEYIPRRMQELGYGNNYLLRFRHLVMQPGEKRVLNGFGKYYWLVTIEPGFSVLSEFGLFDLDSDKINEQQYEHSGKITVLNREEQVRQVKFIQVIINNEACL